MKERTLEALGEDRLLERIRTLLDPAPKDVVGMGDDAAVLGGQLWTTDTLVENVHFRRAWCTPEELGWKALAINLSDVAAMGGVPRAALVSLILPGDTPVNSVLRFYRGLTRLARPTGVAILGGNLSRGASFSATLAVLGDLGERKPLLRSGAGRGDRVVVSGQPGLAHLGYLILERTLPATKDAWSEPSAQFLGRRKRAVDAYPGGGKAVRRFLVPDPRLLLARDVRPTAMMDVSDGLATDLRRLSRASGAGIVIDLDALPMPRAFRTLCGALGVSPERVTLEGGEDYELVMTLPARAPQPDPAAWHGIGEVVSGNKVWVRDSEGTRPLTARGFDHFKR